jgi:hypothetical protein
MNKKTPRQYSAIGQLVKKALHTKLGAFIGYSLGISGFNRIDAVITRANGVVEAQHSFNSRVNTGAALISSLVSGTTLGSLTSPLPPKYLAVSTSTLTPAATDTTLSGELTVNGFARSAATAGSYTAPASLDAGCSFTFTHTFTATGTETIASAALFDASTLGNMFVEGNLSSTATLNSGETLAVTWTINN